MNRSSVSHSNSTLSSELPLHSLNTNSMQQQRNQRRNNRSLSSTASSIIDIHLVKLYDQLAALEQQQQANSTSIDPNRLKSLLDTYRYSCLQLKARYKIEEERIDRRFDLETRCTRAHFAAKKSELKELLLDRLRRKRKLVVDEMRSAIDIHSRSFDADPLLVTMQPPHPLQAKAYNFRQRPEIGQASSSTSNVNDDEFSALLTMNNIGSTGILSPVPQQQQARKRLVGAFSIFQLPKWTVKDDECEDDIRLISSSRK